MGEVNSVDEFNQFIDCHLATDDATHESKIIRFFLEDVKLNPIV